MRHSYKAYKAYKAYTSEMWAFAGVMVAAGFVIMLPFAILMVQEYRRYHRL